MTEIFSQIDTGASASHTDRSSEFEVDVEDEEDQKDNVEKSLEATRYRQEGGAEDEEMSHDKGKWVRQNALYFRIAIFVHQVFHGWYLYAVLVPFHYDTDEFRKWAFRSLLLVIVPLIAVTHCVTSATKSFTFVRKRQQSFLNRIEKLTYVTCEKCPDKQLWKPTRAKHCKMQGRDVTRFDHFCPVTLNTIGYRNHCIFLKTALLHGVLSLLWLYLFAGYYWKELLMGGDAKKELLEVCCNIAWGLDILFVGLICFMSFGIVCSHSWFALTNNTTIDQISDTGGLVNRQYGSYFFGVVHSLRAFVPQPKWLFFLPLPNNHNYEGYHFPQLGVPAEHWTFEVSCTD